MMKHCSMYCVIVSIVWLLCGCEANNEPAAQQPEPAQPAAVQAPSPPKTAPEPAPVQKDKPATQAFFDAALNGDIRAVESELVAGVSPNAANPNNQTALMLAAFNGHTGIVELMITHGGEVNFLDSIGRTALMFAASGPNEKTVALLLEKGADVNIVDGNEKWTALMFAAAEGQAASVKLLLGHGADRTLKDIDGDTAESFAAHNDHAAVAKMIAEYE